MGLAEKAGAVALVLALLGGAAWYAAERIQSQAETIGALEAEQAQLKVSLEDSETSARNARQQLAMWQWLYEDLQSGFKEVAREREQMSRKLDELRREADVEEFLACPMPDSLYEWVRKN